jgi:hypothetical protein
MTIKALAKQIPPEYRKEILHTNMISGAVATASDASMSYLGIIWKNYIDPNENMDCGLCLQRILENYRQMQPSLIELEKESNLLDQV